MQIYAKTISGTIHMRKTVVVKPLEEQIGKKHSNKIKELVQSSGQLTIDNWNKYISSVRFGDIHYKSVAKYSYVNGIFVDIEEDAKEIGKSRYPYGETMHEIGHHVDASIASKLQTDQCDTSSMYISKIYGCTLDEMFKKEANQYFEKIRKKTTSDKKAWQRIKKELQRYSPRDSNEVSDIWDGATNGKAYAYSAHSVMDKEYWNKVSVGNEGFAEIFEAEIVNPKGLLLIKKYYPKSYDIYREILCGN